MEFMCVQKELKPYIDPSEWTVEKCTDGQYAVVDHSIQTTIAVGTFDEMHLLCKGEIPMPNFKNFVVLRGLKEGNTFFTAYTGKPEDEQVRLADGTVAYEIVGYANTVEEAQEMIRQSYIKHGTTWRVEIMKYLMEMERQIREAENNYTEK